MFKLFSTCGDGQFCIDDFIIFIPNYYMFFHIFEFKIHKLPLGINYYCFIRGIVIML